MLEHFFTFNTTSLRVASKKYQKFGDTFFGYYFISTHVIIIPLSLAPPGLVPGLLVDHQPVVAPLLQGPQLKEPGGVRIGEEVAVGGLEVLKNN